MISEKVKAIQVIEPGPWLRSVPLDLVSFNVQYIQYLIWPCQIQYEGRRD